MPSIIARMNYKAQNLRTIEAIVNTLPPANANRTPLLNYIRNLKITLTCLLDSIHDFSSGPIMRGANGYINYIIDNLVIQANSLPVHITKDYIIDWLQRWDALATANHGTQNLRQNHDGSISDFMHKARGNSVENFVAFLLNVDPVVVNKYSRATPTPNPAAGLPHRNAFAAVNDYADRETLCPLLFDSLHTAAEEMRRNPVKFFTVKDNGFISYIFYDRDSNAINPAQSLTDTIYSSPGLWDNGGWAQNIRNSAAQTQQALAIPLDLETRSVILYHDVNNLDMINSIGHADGGILGFRFIRTQYDPPQAPHAVQGDDQGAQVARDRGGVTFGNIIFDGVGPGGYFTYDTRITFPALDAMDKRQVKSLVTTLIAGSNNLSLGAWLKETQPFFHCANWPRPIGGGAVVTGWNAIKYALSQSAPNKKKNAMMVIGCLLDLKRSGDFMQSASVQIHQDAYSNLVSTVNPVSATNPERIGIFATNDRIAGYISAKIHGNYTMLSMPGKPYSTLVVWNGISKTNAAGTGRAATDATRINRVAKNTLQTGGGNKKQKRTKKKNGGVFTFDNAYWAPDESADDFERILEMFNNMYSYIENGQFKEEDINKCADILHKLYKHIDKSRELIINLFRSYCAAKIVKIDIITSREVIKIKAQFPVFNGEEEMDVMDYQDWSFFKELRTESETDDKVFINAIANKVFEKVNNFLNYLDIAFHHADVQQIMILVRMYKPFADILEEIYMYQATKLKQLIDIVKNELPFVESLIQRGQSPTQVINDLTTFIDLVSFKQSNDIEEKRAEALKKAQEAASFAWAEKERRASPGTVLASTQSGIVTKEALDMEVIVKEAHAFEKAQADNNPFNTFEKFINEVKSGKWQGLNMATEHEERVVFLLNEWNNWVLSGSVGQAKALEIYENLNIKIVDYHDKCLYLQEIGKQLTYLPSTDRASKAHASVILALRFYLLFQYEDGKNNFLNQIATVNTQQLEQENWWKSPPVAAVPNPLGNPFNRTDSSMSETETPRASRNGSPMDLAQQQTAFKYVTEYLEIPEEQANQLGAHLDENFKHWKPVDLYQILRSTGSDEDVANKIANQHKDNQRVYNETHGGGGSTKVVVYSDKIKKLTELNKKLRKNKIKNKNKIEKNNKQINELKDKIKKEKQKEKEKIKKEKEKEKEKIKKEKQKEKEKIKKEKQKETIKKETKQPVKKETKQPVKKETKQSVKKETKQPVKKETKQKQQVNKQKDEKTKKSNTKK
jgi:hypothetical protein|tara:strand:+ start:536 stop:4273 length:3738 start_codon:yes stop_codon:yes gene_type:complete